MSHQAVRFLIHDRRNKGWFSVSNDIWLIDIGRYAKLLYCYLCRCAEDVSICNPSFPDMRRKTGCSHGTIVKTLQELEKVGLIRRAPEVGISTTYEIFDPIVERTQSQVDRPPSHRLTAKQSHIDGQHSHRLTAPQSQVDQTTQSRVDLKEDLELKKTKAQQSQKQHPAPRNGAAKSAQAVQQGGLLDVAGAVEAVREVPPTGSAARPADPTHGSVAAAGSPSASKVAKLEYPEGFETYWKALPEKAQACGKKAAFSSWKTAMKNGATVDEIMAGLERWKASRSWAEGFVTYATTWLNQERWTVQPEQAGAGRAKFSMDDWAGQKSGDVA